MICNVPVSIAMFTALVSVTSNRIDHINPDASSVTVARMCLPLGPGVFTSSDKHNQNTARSLKNRSENKQLIIREKTK